jgi:Flp pilus assembly protein CpaB
LKFQETRQNRLRSAEFPAKSLLDRLDAIVHHRVILQNIPVLAAGQSVEMRGNKPVSVTTVTLALTPEQSERLALGQAEGRLMLATRKLGDERVVQTSGTNVQKLLDISEMPARKNRRPPRQNRRKHRRSPIPWWYFVGAK